jgi:hypothetical protein
MVSELGRGQGAVVIENGYPYMAVCAADRNPAEREASAGGTHEGATRAR